MKTVEIKATTLSDAFFQTLFKCVDEGRDFRIDRGSNAGQVRKEFDFVVIQIKTPGLGDLTPQLAEGSPFPNPVADDYLDDYLPYLMTGEEKEGEAYTYGQRICSDCILEPLSSDDPISISDVGLWDSKVVKDVFGIKGISQMDLMIWTYKNKGYRNNQMILQVGQPTDMGLIDPPCLRHIDTRIQDGALHFFPYFRSWDLYGGFPANLAAIELMKQHCASEIGVGNGEIIASSKGLHLYDYVFEIASAIRGKSVEEFSKDLQR